MVSYSAEGLALRLVEPDMSFPERAMQARPAQGTVRKPALCQGAFNGRLTLNS
ncbi:hypothetical protein GCM10007890_05830 [Methylobacterium tardum]|uniref:Uncharacterized protein n=1 Tax=Methylobacterium tardum TaxID=374432 RepID=A0AA37T884_9HYPH|nr:hypothetical protein GCM10007890_05830 [Methylobacterium tardum]